MPGKLIVIDGVDGAGKTTQADLLVQALKPRGPVAYFDFPRYETSVYGQLIGRCLKGEFGNFLTLSPYLASLPYILDRVSAKPDMVQALQQGHVVCNRYTTSNIAHQAGKLPQAERERFIHFIEQGEYEELGIPQPDYVIFLDIPLAVSQKLIKARQKRAFNQDGQDTSDTDLTYQRNSAEVYRALATARENWFVVSCAERGELLSPKAIHQKIMQTLENYLKP